MRGFQRYRSDSDKVSVSGLSVIDTEASEDGFEFS